MSTGAAGSIDGGGGIGGVRHPPGRVQLAEGRRRIRLTIANNSSRPVRVSSHYPLWRANARLLFDRETARGFRLDIPAGSSVRWAPGETLEIELVAYGGSTGRREA
jgi:urease beta subunit